MRIRGFIKASIIFLISLLGLILLILIVINIPFSHRFLTDRVNGIFGSSGLPVHITYIKQVTPFSIRAEGILIEGPDGDTIIYAGKLKTSFNIVKLLRQKVVLPSLSLEQVKVDLKRGKGEGSLNIAGAFAAKEENPPDTVAAGKKGWDVSLGKASVTGLNFMMSDSVSGIYIMEYAGRLKLASRKMSLAEMTIILSSLEIEDATGSLVMDTAATNEQSEPGPPWNFGIGEFYSKNLNFVYDDRPERFRLDLLSGEIRVKATDTDLSGKKIDFDLIFADRTSAVLRTANQGSEESENTKPSPGPMPWTIHGEKTQLQDISFSMLNYEDSVTVNSLSGLSVAGLNLLLEDLAIDSATLDASLSSLKGDLGNGFSVRSMNGEIRSGKGNTRLELSLLTGHSSLSLNGRADKDIFTIIMDPASLEAASLKVEKSDLSPQDIFYFNPSLKDKIRLNGSLIDPITVSAGLNLENSDLSIGNLDIAHNQDLEFGLKGDIRNIFTPGKATMKISFGIRRLEQTWLKELLGGPGSSLSIHELHDLALDGELTDSLHSPSCKINFRSDAGKIELSVSGDYRKDRVRGTAGFSDVLPGKITGDGSAGPVNGSLSFEGNGIMAGSVAGWINVRIDSARYHNHLFKDLTIEGAAQGKKYSLKADVADSSLFFHINAGMERNGGAIKIVADAGIKADLHELGLTSDSLVAGGMLTAELNKSDSGMSGRTGISGLTLTRNGNSSTINSLDAKFTSDQSGTKAYLSSDFLNGEADFEYPADSIGTFLRNYLEHFGSQFKMEKKGIRDSVRIPSLSLRFGATWHTILGLIIRDSTMFFSNLSISIDSRPDNREVEYLVRGNGLKYKGFQAGTFMASLSDSAGSLGLIIKADSCMAGTRKVSGLRLGSHFSDWNSNAYLMVTDRSARAIYNIDLSSERDQKGVVVKIPSRVLTLNGVEWRLDSPGILHFDPVSKSFDPSLGLHNGGSSIMLRKDSIPGWNNFILDMSGVRLQDLVRKEALPGEPVLTLGGSVRYSSSPAHGDSISTDLNMKDAGWSDLKFKTIKLSGFYASDTAGNFGFDILAGLDSAEIKITGNRKKEGKGSVNAKFSDIPVNTVQPFVSRYLSELGGFVSGEFRINGREDKGNTGNINISNGKLRINALNSAFSLPDNNIRFAGSKMIFQDFRILDSLNNTLTIGGSVDYGHKDNITASLNISSSNLQVMNRKEDRNSPLYGQIFIDSRLSVNGPVTSPGLKGDIVLAKGTDIYFRQAEDLNLSGSAGLVNFTAARSTGKPGGERPPGQGLYGKTSIESVVRIDPATKLNISLSKRMYNIGMTVKGGGELTYNMLVNGQVNMIGRYEISEGSADLKMVGWPNKAFRLAKGGFIRWDGSIDDPEMNLEALNRVRSSYVNPVDNKERNVDFDVNLKVTGRLSAMNIEFLINTQDQYLMSIINTMSPEEQMKQAITILLFEYIDLPGISTSSSYVSEQVNQMVASQLNQLTRTTIQGVDISFGLDTYTQGTASGGQETRTSLSYDVKRKLMNDRAQVEVSGRISETGNQQNSSNVSLNNFSFAYRLDSAGTKFLKVYNEHTYEDVFEGDVIKTGVGFTLRKTYPSLGDIWRKESRKVKTGNKDK